MEIINIQFINVRIREIVFVLFVFYFSDINAHDTTHVHPLITSEISQLIKLSDTSAKAYEDVYLPVSDPVDGIAADKQLLYWGTDFDPLGLAGEGTFEKKEVYLLSDKLDRYNRYNNVIDGVVQEDVPVTKVLAHFQHATSGEEFNFPGPFGTEIKGTEPSSERAMLFFNKSIEWMSGYTEDAKHAGFFVFGQSLHHVEDMSSPAHIHNDSHLTLGLDIDKDAYENWYLPQQKIATGANVAIPDQKNLEYWFSLARSENIVEMDNPWLKIWGSNDASSMVRYYYDRTVFQGNLSFPVDDVFAGLVHNKPVPPPKASGELAEMFPCKNVGSPCVTSIGTSGLYWEEDDMFNFAHWEIEGVGAYQHQFLPSFFDGGNDWWPVEFETNRSVISESNPALFQGRYYIEKLSRNNSAENPLGDAVIPAKIRSEFNIPWVGASVVNIGNKDLRQLQAENLLAPAVEYGAGYVEYWYDVANPPPYLSVVKVFQKSTASSSKVIKYLASWVEELESFDMAFTPSIIEQMRPINTVKSRAINREYEHLDANEEIEIELQFSEPIKEIKLLRIGKYNQVNVCIESDSNCVDITPAAPINGLPPSNVKFDGVKGDSIWRITVLKSQLSGLNGKLVLTVKAIDKNNHRGGEQGFETIGGHLDGTPESPAKRDLSKVLDENDAIIVGGNEYPWHKAGEVDETARDISFSYDYEDGDQNHVLLFDTKKPSASISVDLAL